MAMSDMMILHWYAIKSFRIKLVFDLTSISNFTVNAIHKKAIKVLLD